MAKTSLYNQKAEKVGDLELTDKIFNIELNTDLVHQAVVAQMSNERQVLAHTKDRSEVRGGGRKPWKQKGTGRARVGTIRSPLWIGGGVTFGPRKDRNFKKNINKKMKNKALFMALTDRLSNKSLIVVDSIKIENFKTKDFNNIIEKFETKILKEEKKKRSVLVITDQKDEKVKISARNLEGVRFINKESINIVDVTKFRNVIITEGVVKNLEKKYTK